MCRLVLVEMEFRGLVDLPQDRVREDSGDIEIKQSTGFTWMSHMEAKVFKLGKDVEKGC